MSVCTKTDKKVQILLSTCNGEQYLREQMESFFKLKNFESCKVLIRDDGSTDGTRTILAEYAKLGNVRVKYGDRVGLNESYIWLIQNSDPSCEFYALSDQDDRWFENKIELAIDMLSPFKKIGAPALFASRSILTDSNMKSIGVTVQSCKSISFYNAMIQNLCPGHTQVFNRPLMECLQRHIQRDVVAFDWWVYLLAAGMGNVVFSEAPTVYHRQHQHNTVGYRQSVRSTILRRIQHVIQGDGARVTRQLRAFLTSAGGELSTDYFEELEAFLRGLNSFSDRLWYTFHGKVYRQSRLDSILFHWIYLFGGYR